MGRDARPEISPWRRRTTAADFDPEAVAAECRRLQAEQQRREPRVEPEPERKSEPDEELGPGEKRRIKEAVRALRGS
jgi:hypothetical protein